MCKLFYDAYRRLKDKITQNNANIFHGFFFLPCIAALMGLTMKNYLIDQANCLAARHRIQPKNQTELP